MRSPLPSLLDLEAFEAAARQGSFVAAANELHLTASAVSHRVRSLERQLGVVLFTRHARRIDLTDHGRAYLPSVHHAFRELTVSTASLFGGVRPSQRLTARVPISYAVACVAPRLHEFTQAHPDLDVRLVSAIWADSLAAEDVDLDVRFGTGKWPGHQADLLHRETATAVWAERYAARFGPVTTIDMLARGPRAHVLGMENLWLELLGPAATPLAPGDITVDTSLAAIELALSGAYSTLLPSRFVARHLADGQLTTLPGASVQMTEAHFLVQPLSRTSRSPQADSFARWLRSIAD